jgi:predicted XRE-type DNA-binding protein
MTRYFILCVTFSMFSFVGYAQTVLNLEDLSFIKSHMNEISMQDAVELEEVSKKSDEMDLDLRTLILWGKEHSGSLEGFWTKVVKGSKAESEPDITPVEMFLEGKFIYSTPAFIFSFYRKSGDSLVLPSGFSSLKYYFVDVIDKSDDHNIQALETKLRSKDNKQVAHDARALLIALNAQGFSQLDMARIFNVSQTTVSRFINKKAFCLKLILNIREYYMSQKDSLFTQPVVFKPMKQSGNNTPFSAHLKKE